jgi:hypothetical protein
MKARAAKHLTPERVEKAIKATRMTLKIGAIVTTLGFLLTLYAVVMAVLTLSNIVQMVKEAYDLVKGNCDSLDSSEPTFTDLRDVALDSVVSELVKISPAALSTFTDGLHGLSDRLGGLSKSALLSVVTKLNEEAPYAGEEALEQSDEPVTLYGFNCKGEVRPTVTMSAKAQANKWYNPQSDVWADEPQALTAEQESDEDLGDDIDWEKAADYQSYEVFDNSDEDSEDDGYKWTPSDLH